MKIRLADLHNDVVTCLSPKHFSAYIRRAEKVGVEAILVSVWTTEMKDPFERIREYRQIIDDTDTDIELLLHIEDAWFVNATNIDELIKLRPYSVGLTWNENNNLAGGAYGDGELTPLGKTIIRKLVAKGIHIDLAHLNRTSFFQVAKVLKPRKLLCTHTCFDEVHPHKRNLTREQIQTIVDSDGIIGLTFVGDFLGSGGVWAHIKYFLDNFGTDNLGIGTDFFGTVNPPKELKKYKDFARLKKRLSDETLARIFHMNFHDFGRTD